MKSSVYLAFEQLIGDLERRLEEMKAAASKSHVDVSKEVKELEEKIRKLTKETFEKLTRWQRVQLSRHPNRPYALDYIHAITDHFIELHGDRLCQDDTAIVAGLGDMEGKTYAFIGHQKGRNTKERQFRNFGMAIPEGYRKALRIMKMAEKFEKPIVTLIDTPGAFPGIEAEERGQAEAIARNMLEMLKLRVPVVCIVIGEGASGGAIAIGIGDRVLMMENTWYSVISPESCSSILWRSWDYKEQAAEALKLTASDMLHHGLINGIIKEPLGGAHRHPEEAYAILKKTIGQEVAALEKLSVDARMQARIQKFAQMGVVQEQSPKPKPNKVSRAPQKKKAIAPKS